MTGRTTISTKPKRKMGRPPVPPDKKIVHFMTHIPVFLVEEIQEWARQHGMSPSQAARAWLMQASTTAEFPEGMPKSAGSPVAVGYFVAGPADTDAEREGIGLI